MQNLLQEAHKCLKCKKPRCQAHCPISTPIPEVIRLFEEGHIHKAGQLLFENNPLSAICSVVCPHETQCKGYCIKGIKEAPVSFCDIERFISTAYLAELSIDKASSNGKKIAVIGSGPAGITASLLLSKKGYQVTLFEMHDKIGGVLSYGIPEFRLPRQLIKDIEQKLIQLGVSIKYNTLVGPVITIDKLLLDGYDAIFIGTGVWNPKTLNIKGETLGHSHYAIDYLKNPSAYHLGDKVVVIGAGNVAMDAARSAKYYGSKEVSICYRRGEAQMTATKKEIEEAKQEGVAFEFYQSPIEITEQGVIFERTKLLSLEDGTEKLSTLPHSSALFECDSVIIAVSQTPKTNIVDHTNGLETKYGLLVTDTLGHTTKPQVYACGDVVSGAKTVINAVVAAKTVVSTIEKDLDKNN